MMRKEKQALELLNLVHGDQAGVAADSAGERLMRWAEAFDAWLDQREEQYNPKLREDSKQAWGDFLGFVGMAPWEADEGDVLAWTKYLQKQGLNKNTIRHKLTKLTKFYYYCIEKQVDEGAEASESYRGFNPVRDYRSLWPKPSEIVDYLGVEEVQALLGAVDRDVSLIGKRDYALILMYLTQGWALRGIHNLRWGDLIDGGQVRVRWENENGGEAEMPPEAVGIRREKGVGEAGVLPGSVWKEIQDYLQASGRLAGMKAEDYVFPPMADPAGETPGGKTEDWDSSRPISLPAFIKYLKRYANCAGLDVEITTRCLRHTAVMLRIEAGDEVEAIWKKFMARETLEGTRRYVNRLVAQAKPPRFKPDGEKQPIRRGPLHAQPGDMRALKHGFYATRLPEEDWEELKIAQPEGLKEEIQAMRIVLRRALELVMETGSWEKRIRSVDMFGMVAMRLARLMKTEKELRDGKTELGESISQAIKEINEEWALELANPVQAD